jgi:hypothetical protein
MSVWKFECDGEIVELEAPTKAEAQAHCIQLHGAPCIFQEEIPPLESSEGNENSAQGGSVSE